MDNTKKNMQPSNIIAQLFGLTTRRIQQLSEDGVLPYTVIGRSRKYDLVPTIKAYITYLQDKLKAQKSETTQNKLEAKLDAEVKLKKARAEMATLELKEMQGQLYRAEDIEKLTNELVYSIRSMMLALPSRLAIDLAEIDTPAACSRYIAKQMQVCLDELSRHEYNPDRYLELIRDREGWKEGGADEEETDEPEED